MFLLMKYLSLIFGFGIAPEKHLIFFLLCRVVVEFIPWDRLYILKLLALVRFR